MRRLLLLCLLTAAPGAGGCIEPFNGTYVHMDLVGIRSPCEMMLILALTPPEGWRGICPVDGAPGVAPGDGRLVHHYELWGTIARTSVVQLTSFTVQPAALFDEQLELERQGARLSDGQPFRLAGPSTFDALPESEQAVVKQRMQQAAAVNAISSYSPARFADDGKTLASTLYVGNYRELSQPHAGTYFGQVQGPPIGGGASVVGGAVLRFPVALYDLDGLALTIEDEPADRAAARPSGLVVVAGTAEALARGVLNVAAANDKKPEISASFGVYEHLDEESYF
jgi:hypothetical protein